MRKEVTRISEELIAVAAKKAAEVLQSAGANASPEDKLCSFVGAVSEVMGNDVGITAEIQVSPTGTATIDFSAGHNPSPEAEQNARMAEVLAKMFLARLGVFTQLVFAAEAGAISFDIEQFNTAVTMEDTAYQLTATGSGHTVTVGHGDILSPPSRGA